MVELRVDRASGLPAYRQLMQQVREALRLGWLRPGDRLPTVREVVATSGVNANTVLKAYRELELAGLVEARQGSGTFVKASPGAGPRQAMTELREQLEKWVSGAHAAGLDNEDIQALLSAVLADNNRGSSQ
ncbi:GntR family transcriptional regulator [Goodfellowiella coeruleoviolacea]|uniref:Transcriptional regulator, GntR family n=1 Tax=Goodfellowiella coeruleoviolacea TaxID=334858 RepID=A0AAE3KHK5_9PSEU|nr:GntR family transcriptional regulator [Goodfellowiella coeruleoviolacea]MCP2166534.1 transcriptional regulator, GntR family [Goodfellowiella coeruleoviolacea]